MLRSTSSFLVPLGLSLAVLALPLAAQAQSLRVKCEVRGDRSTASVDGSGLAAGQYVAVLASGGKSATSAAQPAVAGQAEFDFSSQPRDIRKGATAIPANFIVDRQVTGALYDANGQLLVSATRACRQR